MKKRNQHRDLLLTVIAYDSDSGRQAQALLKKYGKQPAKTPQDLEEKLAQLYYSSPDQKIEIEKALAEMHPHRRWLMKYEQTKLPIEVKKEEVKIEPVSKAEGEKKSGCDGCNGCSFKKEVRSSAEGSFNEFKQQNSNAVMINQQTIIATIAAVSIVGIVALALNKK